MSFLVMSFVFVKTCVEKVFVHPPQIIELETSLYYCSSTRRHLYTELKTHFQDTKRFGRLN